MQQKQRHHDVGQRIKAVTDGETDTVALMATVACELYQADERFDWLGFYRNIGSRTLKIGPYQGGHGCLTIPFSKGVCGRCAATGEIQIVDNVDADPTHIACSASTRSELVIPIRNAGGALLGVLDIDSDRPAAFDAVDADELDTLMRAVFQAAESDC